MEVGAGYVTIYPDTSSFHNALASAVDGTLNDRTGQQAANSFFSPWQVAIGNLLADMGRTLIGSVSERMTEAIGRLDTLTNYPKVMEGFNYTAQEAEESIELIMDRLVGLPTKTQEMVQFTQALADSTGDLDLATRGALAFNDALLATGASTVDQMRAQRIFNRIVGSGTATVNQWSALMSVMPLQLGMTSRAMLGAEASTEDLGIALREGKVSIEDILRTMVQLDEQGFEGMDSFNEQAWNMAFTLQTALDLIPTRVSNALAAIMGEIGRDNIMAPFLAMANEIKDGGNAIVSGIQWLKHMFDDELHSIVILAGQVGRQLSEGFGVIGSIIVEALKYSVPFILEFISGGLTLLKDAFNAVAETAEYLAPSIEGLVGTLAPILETLRTGLFGLFQIALPVVQSLFVAFIEAVNGAIAILTPFIFVLGQIIDGVFQWLITNGQTVQMVLAGIVAGFLAFQAITFLQSVPILLASVMTAVDGVRNAAFSLFTTLAANPLVLIASLIAGVVAAIGWWITQTEEGQQWWQNFCETASAVFSAFGDLVGAVVGSVVDFFKNLVSKVKDFLDKLKSTVQKVMDAIKKFFTGGAKEILSGVLTPITELKNKFGNIVNGMKNLAGTAWNGIKSLAGTVFNGVKSVIGNAVDGAKNLASTAWNNMKNLSSSAWNSMKSSASTVFNGIKSTIGSALDGAKNLASTALSGIQGFINNLTGKTVNVTVKDGTPGGTASLVSNINNEIKKARGTTIDINVRKTGINGIQLTPSYSGGRVTSMWATTMAKGGTITSPTIALIGEAGYNETVIPNTPWGVRPLAQAVAAEVSQSKGGVLITGNTFNVRNDRDIESVANRLNDMISRQMGGRL